MIIGNLPVNLQNGTNADASQVMADLNFIVNQVNANGQPAGTISPGALVGIQILTASAAYTPTPGATKGLIEICGGGGGGGGAQASSGVNTAGSGGNGGTAAKIWIPSGLQSYAGTAVTIGAGGIGGNATFGGNGGATTFGSYISCGGGAGGIYGASAGPTIATSSNSAPSFSSSLLSLYTDITGWADPATFTGATNSWANGGRGGASILGLGGRGASVSNTGTPTFYSGTAGQGYGAGGGGAAVTIVSSTTYGTTTGYNGTPGVFIIYEFE